MTAEFELERFDDGNGAVAERLWQLYRHDMSDVVGSVPDEDGLFRAGRLSRYRSDPAAPGFLVRVDGAPVGFCAVLPGDGFTSMGDFFVVRARRRDGLGAAVAATLITARPGPWRIAFQDANVGAAAFWRRVVRRQVGDAFREEHRPVPGRPELPPDHWLHFVQP